MISAPLNVLILCTGNSCRSIMAEALLNHYGKGRVAAFSAGSTPTGTVHPSTLSLLRSRGIATAGLRSKSWNEFSNRPFDVVITVCDNAAGEACPIFPGTPVRAHWGVPDPAHATGSEEETWMAFERAYQTLEARVNAFLRLSPPLTKEDLSRHLRTIGETVR